MKRLCILLSVLLTITSCNSVKSIEKGAAELCRHIPVTYKLEESGNYLTEDYYASLMEMVNLDDFTPVLHQWEFWFTAADGSAISDNKCIVKEIVPIDDTHAKAVVSVQPTDSDYKAEEHTLTMEKSGGKWLLADFDDTREAALRYISNHRKEEEVMDVISEYLVKEIGPSYLQGDICIPVIMTVAYEEDDPSHSRIWGDFWVEWYTQSADTLKTVSGGNHSGCISLEKKDGKLAVTGFEQTADGTDNLPSAKRIFGTHYDVFHNIHSNQDVRNASRKLAIQNYCRQNGISAKYFQDYGWPTIKLEQ